MAGTVAFREKITARDSHTGQLLWGEGAPSLFLVTVRDFSCFSFGGYLPRIFKEILGTLDRWFATQTLKKARSGGNCPLLTQPPWNSVHPPIKPVQPGSLLEVVGSKPNPGYTFPPRSTLSPPLRGYAIAMPTKPLVV